MAENKKYYYLKLKENFFDSEEMKLLKSMENGYEYACILLEMYLQSLKNNGKLVFQETIPYNPQMLSVILGHNIAIIEKAIKIFKDLNLIELLETGEIFLLNIQSYIGKSSSEADRIRDYRKAINDVKCLNSSTESVQMYDKRTPEIKIEIEKEIELELEKEEPTPPPKEPKEVKHKYGEYNHVLLTDKEYESLVTDFQEPIIKDYIKKIDEYLEQYGKKGYKNYNLTIRNWIRRDKTNNTTKTSYSKPSSFTEYNQRNVDFDEIEKQAQSKIGTETTEDWREKLKKTRETMDNKKLEGK